jgi:cell division protein ZapE
VPQAHGPRRDLIDYIDAKAISLGYTLSPSQCEVIHSLGKCAELLLAANEVQGGLPQSLYLYGKAGRGKSWLVDTFFQAVPLTTKWRVHFHVFFNLLHQGMFANQGNTDPLGTTLDEMLQDCTLLCFDEFYLHDIGDAMLISRLLKALFERSIMLIVTSNYAPEGLLPNPLYHKRLLPMIKQINSEMQVQEVDGEQDYRTLPGSGQSKRFTQGYYVWPGTTVQRETLGLPTHSESYELPVGQRHMRVQEAREGYIRFTFEDLFEHPTAVGDYLTLCETYDDWTIEQLPLLDDCSIAVQQRFINLVDVIYDHDKRLTVTSSHPLDHALRGKAVDLMRSESRLGQLRVYGPHNNPW